MNKANNEIEHNNTADGILNQKQNNNNKTLGKADLMERQAESLC